MDSFTQIYGTRVLSLFAHNTTQRIVYSRTFGDGGHVSQISACDCAGMLHESPNAPRSCHKAQKHKCGHFISIAPLPHLHIFRSPTKHRGRKRCVKWRKNKETKKQINQVFNLETQRNKKKQFNVGAFLEHCVFRNLWT